MSKTEGYKFNQVSYDVWKEKYAQEGEIKVEDTWARVAKALSRNPEDYEENYKALENFRFIPAGRILAGAGTSKRVTLFNCFVMGRIEDSLDSIFSHLREAALTMQQGGGIGYDFSTIRPKGAKVVSLSSDASGPISFMRVWNSMCETIMSAGSRRGAMMATLRCDHPDIEEFITVKQTKGELTNFNLSVLATDDFLTAVANDKQWDLRFKNKVYKTVSAKELYLQIMRATYEFSEPGIIFIDRINGLNNLNYVETISATNPCGEQPLPPYGACLLGSINLTQFISDPFKSSAFLNLTQIANTTQRAVDMMDRVVDISGFPLESQRVEALAKRRIGLGITGLADAFAMLGVRYGSEQSVKIVEKVMSTITIAAYEKSAELAKLYGWFPLFNSEEYKRSSIVKNLPFALQNKIYNYGLRNALLTSIAPTGTISLLANNVSSGIEPIFAYGFDRKIRQKNGEFLTYRVLDYAADLYYNTVGKTLPDYFVTAQNLTPNDHIAIQAAVQPWIDSSISKTINLPKETTFDEFVEIYNKAHEAGLKGCTTYRPSEVRGSILSLDDNAPKAEVEPKVEPKAQAPDLPAPRPSELTGKTYKLKWPHSDHAMYITINDLIEADGATRPFEIFVNSKNMEHHAWISALTRMISAIFRRGGDVNFVAEELRQVFDPRGGAWVNGTWVPSLIAQIGNIIGEHIGQDLLPKIKVEYSATTIDNIKTRKEEFNTSLGQEICPTCHTPGLIRSEGCVKCTHCNYSKC